MLWRKPPSRSVLFARVGAMLRRMFKVVFPISISAALFCTSGCASSAVSIAASAPVAPNPPVAQSTTLSSTPIQHIVIIMQENRSFDNLFNGFPGADTVQTGMYKGAVVPLTQTPLGNGPGFDHSHTGWWQQWDGGAMDNFGSAGNLQAYSYINPREVAPYWTLARNFTLGDRMFQSNTGPSFVAHQYLIAGQSGGASENPNSTAWGCSASADARVALIGPHGTDLPGVFPCFDYQTMGDLLDAKGITWRYYAPSTKSDSNFLLSAYQAIRHIFFGPDWNNNVMSPETTVLADIAAGQLAQVTWIVPAYNNSDHPGAPALGPDWVASIVNAIGKSKFWDSTAIFITWDDWGGGTITCRRPRLTTWASVFAYRSLLSRPMPNTATFLMSSMRQAACFTSPRRSSSCPLSAHVTAFPTTSAIVSTTRRCLRPMSRYKPKQQQPSSSPRSTLGRRTMIKKSPPTLAFACWTLAPSRPEALKEPSSPHSKIMRSRSLQYRIVL